MTDERERLAWLWLSGVEGIGPVHVNSLVGACGSAAAVLEKARAGAPIDGVEGHVTARLRGRADLEPARALAGRLEELGITFICRADDEYPDSLRNIYDPPVVLYTVGDLSLLKHPRLLAMVGTRHPTRYGEAVARKLSADLAGQGVAVVSGMARGTDSTCHWGCLNAGGRTVAVLGCGVDVVYPPENGDLYRAICDRGLVLSELPPGTQPAPGNFPCRNRIISGLSHGIVVVEAAQKSGTLFTVDYALDQGRDVFAVPGNINSPMSYSTNQLIKNGCQVVTEADDILSYYGWKVRAEAPRPVMMGGSPEEMAVLNELSRGDMSFDQLFEKMGMPVPALMALLSRMELKRMIVQLPGRMYGL